MFKSLTINKYQSIKNEDDNYLLYCKREAFSYHPTILTICLSEASGKTFLKCSKILW